MKIPSASNLAKVKMLEPIIPTVEDNTSGCELLVEMIDGTVGDYLNEGGIELEEKYNNIDAFFSSTGLEQRDLPEVDTEITTAVQSVYPNVKNVYVLNL